MISWFISGSNHVVINYCPFIYVRKTNKVHTFTH